MECEELFCKTNKNSLKLTELLQFELTEDTNDLERMFTLTYSYKVQYLALNTLFLFLDVFVYIRVSYCSFFYVHIVRIQYKGLSTQVGK